MGLTLNQLLEAALLEGQNQSLEKIAQEAGGESPCASCGRPAAAGSDLCKACAEKAAKKEEAAADTGAASGPEKTSSARVEKLASAVEYIDQAMRMGQVSGRIKVAEPGQTAGPGIGPNTLPTDINSPHTERMPNQIGGSGATSTSIPLSPPMEAGANPKAAKSSMGTDEKQRPGGNEKPGGGLLGSGPGPLTQGGSNHIKKAMLLRKAAADDSGASISSPKTSASPEDQPSSMARPAEVTGQERMIASNEAAIDFTKREAMSVPKKRMGEVLDEPAQSKAGDSALHDALGADVVAKGGAKIASARRRLQKIAAQGCTCGGLEKGACDHCRISSKVEQLRGQRGGAGFSAARAR